MFNVIVDVEKKKRENDCVRAEGSKERRERGGGGREVETTDLKS